MNQDLPKIKIKSSVFILLSFVIVVAMAFIFIPKSNWQKIFHTNRFATVFSLPDSNKYTESVNNGWTASGNAWGENIGWLTFSPNISSTVYVADDALYGYLYGENIGWVSLSCMNTNSCDGIGYGVSNDGAGNLSGFAWGENIGWIDFGPGEHYQVTISDAGTFSGYAWGENVGWINFGIGTSSATTTWTYVSSRYSRRVGGREIVPSPSPLPASASSSQEVSSVSIYPLDLLIKVGSTTAFTSSVLDQDNQSFSTTTVWSSSNNYIGTINSNGLFNALSLGTTTITVTAGSKSTSTIARVVSTDVNLDVVAPTIKITNGTPTAILFGSTYMDDGATAADDIDGATTVSVLSNNVNTSATGTYFVIYTTTDSAGNTASSTRTVRVIESKLPSDFCFNSILHPDSTRITNPDPDVKYLQIFLNSQGFKTTEIGNENNSYGQETINGVSLFQKAHNIEPNIGNFGITTRNMADEILGCSPEITHVDAYNEDLIITEKQSGTLTYTEGTVSGNIKLDVPNYAVDGTTTFRITEEQETSDNTDLISTGTQLVNGVFYNINANNKDGNIHSFSPKFITITLPIPPELIGKRNLGVYWLNESIASASWVLIPNARFDYVKNQVTFDVDHLTKFAIFVINNELVKDQASTSEGVAPVVEDKIEKQTPTSDAQNTGSQDKEGAAENKTSVPSNITESIKQTYAQTAIIVQKSIEQTAVVVEESVKATKEAVNTPIGSAVTKSASTVGVVAGASATIGAVAFANPITLAEIWLIPAKVFGLLMGALGIKRKTKKWGTVYDSVTKRPLDPVYVSLINTETNKEVASALTDIDGRYGFLVLPGKYKIVAEKTNYMQPSMKMSGRSFDEVYNDLYFGEEIAILQEGEIITKNIPMDSMSFDWNEFAKTKMNVNTFMKKKDITLAKTSRFLFILGGIVALIALIFAPAPYNFIIFGLYIITYIFNYVVFKTKKTGTLIEKTTGVPLSFAIVKIFREGEDMPLAKKIADQFGHYYVLLPNGRYYLKVERKNDDETYTETLKTEVMDISGGIINVNFII